MNKKIYLLPLLLLAILFTSCEETKEVSKYDNWQERNEAFIDSLRISFMDEGNPGGLDTMHLLTYPDDYFFYKKMTPATELEGYIASSQKPLFTDSITVFYKGTYFTGEYFDGFTGSAPTVFDAPIKGVVSSGWITGWTEVLQRISLGERWKVYIPSEFAYGSSGKDKVPGYSALVFDMQLYGIIPAPDTSKSK